MSSLHPLLSHYWTLSLLLALLLPGPRSLAAVFAATAPVLIVANLGDEARLASACVIALGIALSLALGRTMRAVLAGLSATGRARAIAGLLAACAILILPNAPAKAFAALAHATTVKIRSWDARSPSGACLARRYPVTVAGAGFYLPAAPLITVRSVRNSWHFQYGRSLRSLCRRAAPLHATNVNIDFSIPVRDPFCKAARGAWEKGLCAPAARDARPAMVNIYAPAEYDRQHMMPAPTYASFADLRDKAAAGGHPLVPEQTGLFDHYANGYWVARAGAWKNDAGEPYTLRCQDTDPSGMLSCDTTYRLKQGPEITYRFSAPARTLARAAHAVDGGLHAMLEQFSAPGEVPPASR